MTPPHEEGTTILGTILEERYNRMTVRKSKTEKSKTVFNLVVEFECDDFSCIFEDVRTIMEAATSVGEVKEAELVNLPTKVDCKNIW
jgi:hypothetical protein